MSVAVEKATGNAPTTYQEWLICLERMKRGTAADGEAFEEAKRGAFVGSELTKNALQRQMVETVNAVLNKSVKRFARGLNESIAFGELAGTSLLFKRLKADIHKSLFFTELTFLPEEFRGELERSVKEQMNGFWEETVAFLRNQRLDFSNEDLEDLLFAVKRIRLF